MVGEQVVARGAPQLMGAPDVGGTPDLGIEAGDAATPIEQ